MKYDYKDLLQRARIDLPETISLHKRLRTPHFSSSVLRMRTLIHNFKEVSEILNRKPQHLLKFLTGEMATAAIMQESRVVFKGKFSNETLQRLLGKYIALYINCPICKRPDTKIVKEKRLSFLICEACGAKSSIKNL